MSKNSSHLASRKWKKQRELVFRTMGHDCYICGEWADAVDHVISRKLYRDWETDRKSVG